MSTNREKTLKIIRNEGQTSAHCPTCKSLKVYQEVGFYRCMTCNHIANFYQQKDQSREAYQMWKNEMQLLWEKEWEIE